MNLSINLSTVYQIIYLLLIINTIGALVTVFRKPRSIASTLAWMIALIFLPGIGFILYVFLGRGIDGEVLYRFSEEHQERIAEINEMIARNNQEFSHIIDPPEGKSLKRYFYNLEESPISKGNNVTFYTDGQEKFESLFEDIRQATDNIHVEYYAFFNDTIGNRFLNILVEKAKEGIEVRLVYDPWGGKTPKSFFEPLLDAGGKVTPFVTARNLIRKTRLNYHLHRKIVVIDGEIGWTGGFNVGDQYLEITNKFGYWRDTHSRIVGTASFSLQEIFIRDWNASVEDSEDALEYEHRYFIVPEREAAGEVTMQVVADGPESEEEILKNGFVKMILAAEKRVLIQTPYLVPDDTMTDALLIAVRSGVEVNIMIPHMPDHPFIYRASQYYANYLHARGVNIYIFEGGFLHAKTVIIDDKIASFGTTNQDIRSYALNFEVNAFTYNKELTDELTEIFEEDLDDSTLLTTEMINEQSRWLRFKQNFSRLLSPIL